MGRNVNLPDNNNLKINHKEFPGFHQKLKAYFYGISGRFLHQQAVEHFELLFVRFELGNELRQTAVFLLYGG